MGKLTNDVIQRGGVTELWQCDDREKRAVWRFETRRWQKIVFSKKCFENYFVNVAPNSKLLVGLTLRAQSSMKD
jgi:hypothetical protein